MFHAGMRSVALRCVAQISKPAVSPIFQFGAAVLFGAPAGIETLDTAGLETCAAGKRGLQICVTADCRSAPPCRHRAPMAFAAPKVLGKRKDCFTLKHMKTVVRTAGSSRVPVGWRKAVQRVLITETAIARRLRAMSREIERDFKGREMVIVSLLNGTVMFLADLVRHISLPLRLDFIGVSSYGDGVVSGNLVFTKELRLDVRGRDVLLVDDILDTGKTMARVLEKLTLLRPRRIRICVLLSKEARRTENVRADYVGFEIPDEFVVGYGLDFAERYRNLPFVGVLHPAIYERNTS